MKMHTYAEARIELKLPKGWLERNIKRLPHTAFGRNIRFSDEEIDLIRAMHAVRPAEAPAPVAGVPAVLLSLKPAGARHRSATG